MAVKKVDSPKSTSNKAVQEPQEEFSPFSVAGIRSGAVRNNIVKGSIIAAGVVMALGVVMTSIGPSVPPVRGGGGATGTAAKVGGQNLSKGQLEYAFQRQMQQNEMFGMKTGVTNYMQAKFGALQQLTDNAANIEAAQAAGIAVSNEDIDKKIDDEINTQLKPQGTSEAAFRRQIEAQYGSMDAARAKMREGVDRDAVRKGLLLEKLEKQVKDENKVTEEDYKRSVTKLKLWQIIVRPKPVTLVGKEAEPQVEKNKAEAKERATKIYNQLKGTPDLAAFKKVAIKDSDDESTKKKGGDLGWKLPNELYYAPGMGDAVGKSPSNLVAPIFDDSGAGYIFFIESRKTELPKDFAKNKKKLVEDYETQKDNDAWSQAQQGYKKLVSPQVYDSGLQAYQIQSTDLMSATGDDAKKLRQDALNLYSQAVGSAQGMEAAALHYQMSQLYGQDADKIKAQEQLALAVKAEGSDPQLLLDYAHQLREGGKPKEALVQAKAAAAALDKQPNTPSMFGGNPNDQVRQQLAMEFQALKEPKLADAEMKKVTPPSAQQGGGMFGNNVQIR